jgi:hypothetical protein
MDTKDEVQKREYHKPAVLKIELKPEEVLAVGCKTSTGNSSAFGPAHPCRIQPCSQLGS